MIANNRKNLIGISGKLGSGKDTIGKIILDLTNNDSAKFHDQYTIKKYADKLKDIICILIGCTRVELEDREFKEKELGEEWRVYVKSIYQIGRPDVKEFITKKQYDVLSKVNKVSGYDEDGFMIHFHTEVHSPRTLMQCLGTECGRRMIHPDIWINSLFSEYKPLFKDSRGHYTGWTVNDNIIKSKCKNCNTFIMGTARQLYCQDCFEDDNIQDFPKWIISDVRFPKSEGLAITDRDGFNIGIKRLFKNRFPQYADLEDIEKPYEIPKALYKVNKKLYDSLTHESEQLMGDFTWCDYIIENDGTVDDLIGKVKEILIKEQII